MVSSLSTWYKISHEMTLVLLLLLGLLALGKIHAEIRVTDYLTRKRFKGYSLSYSSGNSLTVRSLLECCSVCAKVTNCASINFCKDTHICSLNQQNVCQTGYAYLSPSPACTYYDFLDHPDDEVLATMCSPSPCNHGGTCEPVCGQHAVKCSCVTSYYGDYCENLDGGWSLWTAWSSCDRSCNRERTRSCTAPIPVGAGSLCTGGDQQTRSCSSDECGDDE